MGFSVHTAAERPDLWERSISSESVWPDYNLHGDVLNKWWRYLDEEIADFQFVLYDEAEDEMVAEGHTGPLWWDGVDETLPGGIDEAIEQIFALVREQANPRLRTAAFAATRAVTDPRAGISGWCRCRAGSSATSPATPRASWPTTGWPPSTGGPPRCDRHY